MNIAKFPRQQKPKRLPFAERKPKKVDAGYLDRAAIYYLQRFAASRARLQEVLLRKVARRLLLVPGAEDVRAWLPEIEKLLNRYEEIGLLNDTALAESRVAAMRRGGGSARNIAQKMTLKGFEPATITKAVEQHDAEENMDDADAIIKFMQKKRLGRFRRPEKIVDEKLIRREIGALLRAGYNYALVKTAMQTEDIMPPEV